MADKDFFHSREVFPDSSLYSEELNQGVHVHVFDPGLSYYIKDYMEKETQEELVDEIMELLENSYLEKYSSESIENFYFQKDICPWVLLFKPHIMTISSPDLDFSKPLHAFKFIRKGASIPNSTNCEAKPFEAFPVKCHDIVLVRGGKRRIEKEETAGGLYCACYRDVVGRAFILN